MIDHEVERLRRLRGSALQLRAVARTLSNASLTRNESLVNRGGCAAWRLARTISGRLRAHPNARYQKDAGLGTLIKNSLVAVRISATSSNRRTAMTAFGSQLKAVLHELDNARALTWAADLGDLFGRSQREIGGLIAAVERQTHGSGNDAAAGSTGHGVSGVDADSRFLTI